MQDFAQYFTVNIDINILNFESILRSLIALAFSRIYLSASTVWELCWKTF